mmetsp:Transcript_13646/g.57365  ORF Transcript_13646/g.57365 Transcript_13646/m.57365 type:complete len:291 (+) Transcript_13646:2871-3743(+)
MLGSTRATGPRASRNAATRGSEAITFSFEARSLPARSIASRRGRRRASSARWSSKSSPRACPSCEAPASPAGSDGSTGVALAGSLTARSGREDRRAGAYPRRSRGSRTARAGWDPATDPARPTRGVAGDAAPLVVADLWLRRRRSLALANGGARAASADGCRAVAVIEGSMVSTRREQNSSRQSSREARVGCVEPCATARMVRCRCENRWSSTLRFFCFAPSFLGLVVRRIKCCFPPIGSRGDGHDTHDIVPVLRGCVHVRCRRGREGRRTHPARASLPPPPGSRERHPA